LNSAPALIKERHPKIMSDFVHTVVRKMLLHLSVQDDAWEQLNSDKQDDADLNDVLDDFANTIGILPCS
jgi:hypothetical protein